MWIRIYSAYVSIITLDILYPVQCFRYRRTVVWRRKSRSAKTSSEEWRSPVRTLLRFCPQVSVLKPTCSLCFKGPASHPPPCDAFAPFFQAEFSTVPSLVSVLKPPPSQTTHRAERRRSPKSPADKFYLRPRSEPTRFRNVIYETHTLTCFPCYVDLFVWQFSGASDSI